MNDHHRALQGVLRLDLVSFIAKCFSTLEHGRPFHSNWHIDHIAYQLGRVRDGDITRLIINIPPPHLKSICVTIAYTAWRLGHDPSLKIMTVSYSDDLAKQHATLFRAIVTSNWYRALFPAFQIVTDRNAELRTSQNGYRLACSVGGSILGKGADLIIIDDPIKAQDALSAIERSKVNAFYDNTLYTRLNDKKHGSIILVMQRLHQDDLVGHVQTKEPWETAIIPAIETEARTYRLGRRSGDVYHRQEGELIQPDREADLEIDQLRRTLGSMSFAAQYQQDPVPPSGNVIRRDWIRYYDTRPALEFILISWDTASTLNESSDYSVGTVWGLHGTNIYLLDVIRGRFEVPDLRRRIEAASLTYKADATLIEETDIGRALIQEMRTSSTVRPIAWRVRLDKEARLLVQAPKIEAGQVLLPKDAPWLADYLSELLAFPNARHDDQVDSTSQALSYLSEVIKRRRPHSRPNPARPQGYPMANTVM